MRRIIIISFLFLSTIIGFADKKMTSRNIPYMYSLLGIKKYEDTVKCENPDGYAEDTTPQDREDRRKAVEYFLKADEQGALTRQAAQLLYHYLNYDQTSI